ncbi:MAG: hypothetical protein N4A63_14570 [Vallitalea sp.]|jgi:hypothetical protein|nr:hypothetical protein [Vallitalea sp.]
MKKTNKEKFNELSRRQKVDYIWEYYKIHISAGIIAIIIIGSLLNTLVLNPPPKAAVSVNFMGKHLNSNNTQDIEDKLNSIIITKEMGNKKVFINLFNVMSGKNMDPQLDMATNTKFAANVSAKELDVLIIEKDKFLQLVSLGTMLPLDEILSVEELDKLGEKIIEGKGENDTKNIKYGIDVTNNEKVKSIMVGNDKKVMCVVSNSQRLEESLKVIKWFLDIK